MNRVVIEIQYDTFVKDQKIIEDKIVSSGAKIQHNLTSHKRKSAIITVDATQDAISEISKQSFVIGTRIIGTATICE
jgi:hypothetical protein